MQDRRVAKRYAKALFNAALKQGIVKSVSDDLATVTGAISNNENFRIFLKNPKTSEADKLRLFERTFGDKTTALTMGFIRLLLDKRRDDEIFGVRMVFEDLRRIQESVSMAVIASSTPLDDGQKKAVVAKFEKELGKKLEAEFVVDPALMGGVKVTFDNYVLDGTVRGQLDRMKEKLLYDLLKQA